MALNTGLGINQSFTKLFKQALVKETYKNKFEVQKTCYAMNMLVEYIRYCVFDGYVTKNIHQLNKYCRLLFRFDSIPNETLQLHARACMQLLLQNCLDAGSPILGLDVSLTFSRSLDPTIRQLCHDVMTRTSGYTVRGVHF